MLKVVPHTGGERELVKAWFPCGFVRKPEDAEVTCLLHSVLGFECTMATQICGRKQQNTLEFRQILLSG